ncbi:MAG: tRNA (adenosine(37)-N6)-threonylcarbamoyltransferase complex ATPase subunit type 1 TsaE [Anaerolineaceae bacterium]|nr:tRNA (adenosine(37)-N6)-threonylcarbamoyltransferase complex ATPase subunit type 1 TsaE [Anaerolineaceae bacterium]
MPILDQNSMEFLSRSPAQSRRLGIRLGALLEPGDVLCFSGNLGSGKTTFVQGLAQGWGSLDTVTSPTFVLVNVYQRPDGLKLHHLDAYRLQNSWEAEELDLILMMENGILAVEWPEKIEDALPSERLWINMEYVDEEQREMLFTPVGEHYTKLVAEFRRQVLGG